MSAINSSFSPEPSTASEVDPEKVRKSVLQRLRRFGARARWYLISEGISILFFELAIALILTFALDRIFRLSLNARLVIDALLLLLLLVECYRRVIRPFFIKLDPISLAASIDRASAESWPPRKPQPLARVIWFPA